MNWLIYGMIYLGSALMVYNVYSYTRYALKVQKREHWDTGRFSLYMPVLLLSMFLLGYLAVGFFGKPDIIVSLILFGGSIFVFIVFRLLERITDRIAANEHFESELRVVEESNKAKSSFLSNISHEMRTPMNAIIGLNTLALRNPDLPDEARGQLEKIGVSASHLLGLVDNILDMSNIDAGNLELRNAEFNLDDVLKQLDSMFSARCSEKGLSYSSRVSESVDGRYIGDSLKLRQVLFCVLDNAVKFTPVPGSVSIVTDQLKSGGSAVTLRFTVSDTGIGIDESFMPRLFTSFAQEDSSTTSQYGGSGLGLALSKKLVEMMDGDITVISRKGEGSIFTVTVKLGVCSDDSQDTLELRVPAKAEAGGLDAQGSEGLLEGRHILIAEDIDLNAEIVADLLDMEGATSERAQNGSEAVDLFLASPPWHFDAVLMDLRMPVMDGFEATRTIRAADRPDAAKVPIIALTANASDEDRRKSIAAGMDEHIAKPLDADILYDALRKHIAAH